MIVVHVITLVSREVWFNGQFEQNAAQAFVF